MKKETKQTENKPTSLLMIATILYAMIMIVSGWYCIVAGFAGEQSFASFGMLVNAVPMLFVLVYLYNEKK